jgi:plasmid stabilization system protein ParE
MRKIALTRAARQDLLEIQEFIAQDSPAAAARLRNKLREAMARLADLPQSGHLRRDLADEPLRFSQVYSFLIVYRPETRPLEVIRVLHASRDGRSCLAPCTPVRRPCTGRTAARPAQAGPGAGTQVA